MRDKRRTRFIIQKPRSNALEHQQCNNFVATVKANSISWSHFRCQRISFTATVHENFTMDSFKVDACSEMRSVSFIKVPVDISDVRAAFNDLHEKDGSHVLGRVHLLGFCSNDLWPCLPANSLAGGTTGSSAQTVRMCPCSYLMITQTRQMRSST